MENNENKTVESIDEKPKMPIQKSKLKIKRFRRKDGEKKQKKDPNTPKHPLTGNVYRSVICTKNFFVCFRIRCCNVYDLISIGYIRYMNVRREELKKVKPESTAIEVSLLQDFYPKV